MRFWRQTSAHGQMVIGFPYCADLEPSSGSSNLLTRPPRSCLTIERYGATLRTLTDLDLMFPAESRAMTVIVCLPSGSVKLAE
jgi:hypothetical protein